ncbi:transglycosylase SLT domain-containing protein [Streptomyces sp. 6N223]|uniref:aggregation-promoting factor C-terminal-like domain-containing protein n=1 Tax=Streptomyces sp. 6N223 TaxID=3457412 RepID=UPI003FD66E99
MSLRTALRQNRSRARRLVAAGLLTATATTIGVTGLSGSASAADASDISHNRALARQMISDDEQFSCFRWIVNHESDWDHTATNPTSGAYGLVQALPAKRMSTVDDDWKTNPATQIEWGLKYMKGRYGSPCEAKNFWEVNGWY